MESKPNPIKHLRTFVHSDTILTCIFEHTSLIHRPVLGQKGIKVMSYKQFIYEEEARKKNILIQSMMIGINSWYQQYRLAVHCSEKF